MTQVACSKCGASNRETARFCVRCGANLFSPARQAPPQHTLRRGQQLQGRYRIEKELGRGGFSAVYQAWDSNLLRWCAVKENRVTGSEAQRQFLREATILANISHPNLPRVVDHFYIPEQGQYLVMDFIEGEDLEIIAERQGRLAVDQCLQWIMQVAGALEYLHGLDPVVIHRDIKPANIRLTPKGKAVLVDFGLVKVWQPSSHTTIGAQAITPGYAPPEQYGKGKTDVRTDVYALSATMYRLLSGQAPVESIHRLSGSEVADLSRLNPAVPPSLCRLVEKGMHTDPSRRFQNMAELSAALASIHSNPQPTQLAKEIPHTVRAPEHQVTEYLQPVVQPPVKRTPYSQAAAPWGRINQLFYIGGGAVALLLLLVAALGFTGWWIIRSANQNNANQTSTALAIAHPTQTEQARVDTATAQVFGTQTSVAAQATAQAQASLTAQAGAAATARVQITEQAYATHAYVSALLEKRQLVSSPKSGSLAHHPEDDKVSLELENVDLDNFVVVSYFINPYDASEGLWAYGFLYKTTDDNEYRLIIDSKSRYHLVHMRQGDQNLDKHLVRETDRRIWTGDFDENKLTFIRAAGRGWLYINDVLVTEFDVTSWAGIDYVAIGSGFFFDSEISGKITEYEDFTIWSLP